MARATIKITREQIHVLHQIIYNYQMNFHDLRQEADELERLLAEALEDLDVREYYKKRAEAEERGEDYDGL